MGGKIIVKKTTLVFILFAIALMSAVLVSAEENESFSKEIHPMIVTQFFEKAKKNENWKVAFVTGEQEQIVFMNVSPLTNPKNEIGAETHEFDQVIVIVEGNGKAILNGKTSLLDEGDMIFIPKGSKHNVINLDEKKGLKLISFYSETDIPKDTVYKRKADEILNSN